MEGFALSRLAQVLAILQHKHLGMSPQLAEAIQLIYSKTPNRSYNSARNLLSQFVAPRFPTLLGDHLDTLMAEGGDFCRGCVAQARTKAFGQSIGRENRRTEPESFSFGI